MTKKVLILAGSPRKGGNSDILCAEFMRGAETSGHEVEMIRVADKNIHYCIGCDNCQKIGKCVFQDDMAEILAKMATADVLVFATPVYFYSMTAQLKTLIDRTVAGETKIFDKEVYFIITAADSNKQNMVKVVESLRGFTQDCLKGTIEKGVIYGLGAYEIGDITSSPAMQEAYSMGENI